MKTIKNITLWSVVVVIGIPLIVVAYGIDSVVMNTRSSEFVKSIFQKVIGKID